MNPIITAVLALANNILPGILTGNGVNKTEQTKIQADLQKAILAADTAEVSSILDNLNKQLEINLSESQAGRLGWRNWLGKGLTIALLMNLFVPYILKLIAALTFVVGTSPDSITHFASLLPTFDNNGVMTMLGGLLGLYTARGYEKIQYNKLNAPK